MLRLKGITKNYKVAGGEIEVLKGLNVCFRKSEFVSILGPSGCGKTTTLNIVGGLDKYTNGDLIISGKSTKNFKDHDWDIYRNHRIGFIFQTYNLIPHQTVLGNVELALTISGISKEERVERAMRALERVGLKGEERKRPNQLSGGQCQRVAIARALVNEPDILLADEPTGALDSKTSVQIMELIKEISKDKLVIMVTHNGELAEEYSTRIIRLVDGEITEDTNPYSEEEEIKEYQDVEEETGKKKKNKAKMSWATSFKLSARNLLSKFKRTLLTSIAGSIGIIGISAVLAVSSGVNGFIGSMQDDMLSGNPITVQEQAFDLDAMMSSLDIEDKVEIANKLEDYVYIDSMLSFLANRLNDMNSMVSTNNITQDYVDYVKAIPQEQASVVVDKGLNVANNIYTDFRITDEKTETPQNVSISAVKKIYTSVMQDTKFAENASFISMLGDIFMQAPTDEEYVLSQYDIVDGGKIATKVDEINIVINKDQTLTDIMLAQLGYYNQKEFINIAYGATEDERYDESLYKDKILFEDLKSRDFVWYKNDIIFEKNNELFVTPGSSTPFTYKHDSSLFASEKDNGLKLKIVGILQPKENLNYGCLKAGFYYTEAFAEEAIKQNENSEIVNYLNDKGSKGFNTTLMTVENPVDGKPMTVHYGEAITFKYKYTNIDGVESADYVTGYLGESNAMSAIMSTMGSIFSGGSSGGTSGDGGSSSSSSSSSSTIPETLSLLGRDLGSGAVSNDIKIYAKNLEMKEKVIAHLDAWNDEATTISINGKDLWFGENEAGEIGRTEIKYSDMLSVIMDMITDMVDIITIALISFTSLALVVSCVMIAIITYVSVVERIKEIGVIRSLGGRKRDVSNLFNVETLLIGLASGLIGVGFTYFMSFIVNSIVGKLIGFSIMTLPITSALIMVGLSVGLTVLSGLIPAKKASRQDPVVALRTE